MSVPERELIRHLYASMFRIRHVEEEIERVYPEDKIQSPVHLSIGQEAASVGVCAALEPQDVVYGTYRGHAMYLAKGGDLRRMIAELYGKGTGCAKGKGGSMHLGDPRRGVMGTSAVVATTIPLAVGHALAFKVQKKDAVVVSFFGDGATEEGAFHEALSFASLRGLPILFVCENNRYAIHTPLENRQPAGGSISERAAAYGVPSTRIEDGSVLALYRRAAESVAELRAGGGPRLLEVSVYRWRKHVGPGEDWHLGYRGKQEAEPWFAADQVAQLAAVLEPGDRADIEATVLAEVKDAFEYAEASPAPDLSELYTDVY
jgi:TPP-dependent pyruvate/acetoin dehydrogenase alpha subunit